VWASYFESKFRLHGIRVLKNRSRVPAWIRTTIMLLRFYCAFKDIARLGMERKCQNNSLNASEPKLRENNRNGAQAGGSIANIAVACIDKPLLCWMNASTAKVSCMFRTHIQVCSDGVVHKSPQGVWLDQLHRWALVAKIMFMNERGCSPTRVAADLINLEGWGTWSVVPRV